MKLARTGSLALLTTIALAACNDANGPSEEDLALNEAVAAVAADAAVEDVKQMFVALGAEPALGASYDAAPPRDFSRTVTFYDIGGIMMDAYDPVGVEGAETSRTWNGTGSGTVAGSQHSEEHGDRSYDMASSVVIDAVVRDLPRDLNLWPMSGTITRTVTVTITTADGVVTRERTAVLTFNGTQFAILRLNGDDQEYEVDLAARATDRAHRKRA